MGDTFYRERVGVRKSEEVIDGRELERLRVMAARGTDYEAAARSMRNDHARMLERSRQNPDDEYVRGWLAAMRELAERVVRGGSDEPG